MKKMDEMDRNIQLRSEEFGYKTVLLALCAWTVYNIYQALATGAQLNMLPTLILCLSVCVQGLSQISLKGKMIAGDEEYKEPNKLLQAILLALVLVTLVLSLGIYFFRKA